jgi:hypothetical protein
MPFTKNDININIKGRKVGSQNIKTSELKTLLVSVFESNLSEIVKQHEKLTLHERLILNKTLLPYCLPSIKTELHSNTLEPSIFDTSNW